VIFCVEAKGHQLRPTSGIFQMEWAVKTQVYGLFDQFQVLYFYLFFVWFFVCLFFLLCFVSFICLKILFILLISLYNCVSVLITIYFVLN